jgi:O-antigen/teichoic acid export membrane protein
MNSVITKAEIISSLIWKFLERIGTQGINFIVQIILARLLDPEDFGLVSVITIFVSFANILVQSGFNTSLIQKSKIKEIDYSTVFYFSFFIAAILYVLLFLLAPVIAMFYEQPQLTSILRVLSVTLFIGAVNSIQIAVISRNMQFKKLFYSSFLATLISGFIAILLAFSSLGVWALVIQQISYQFLVTFIMLFTVQWKPRIVFSYKRLKLLFNYGWKILATHLLSNIFLNIRSLIIGKLYSAETLGFYNRGMIIPSVLVSNIDGSIQSVMLPSYSSQQENKEIVKKMVRRSIMTSSFIVFPMMVGLAAVAEPFVSLILTDKWLQAVPFLQIYCFIFALMPIHTANLQAIKALGYSGTVLKLEIIKKAMDILILLITIPEGIYAIAIGELISSLISTLINSYPNNKYLRYSFKEQWIDVLPSLLLSLVMGIIVYSITFIGYNKLLTIIVQILIGVIVYITLALVFKIESFYFLLNSLRGTFKNKDRY